MCVEAVQCICMASPAGQLLGHGGGSLLHCWMQAHQVHTCSRTQRAISDEVGVGLTILFRDNSQHMLWKQPHSHTRTILITPI